MHALIIGSGSIGQRHAESLCTLQADTTFTLLRRKRIEDEISKGLNASVTDKLDDAIASGPDIAVIASPSFAHVDSLIPLLRAGIPCYIEKPLLTHRDDVTQVRKILAEIPTLPITQMGCNLRFVPSLQQLHQHLHEGLIGTVVRATLDVGQWLPDWRPQQDYRQSYSAHSATGGGVILDLIHELDMARWLFGEFQQVHAFAKQRSQLEIRSEDVACISLGGDNTPLVNIGLDYISRLPLRRYTIIGERGSLIWDLRAKQLILETRTGTQTINNNPEDFNVKNTYLTAMREFIECVAQGSSSSQDIFEGLASAELALNARHSAGLPC